MPRVRPLTRESEIPVLHEIDELACSDAPSADPGARRAPAAAAAPTPRSGQSSAPQLPTLPTPRRARPCLLVLVDGGTDSHQALVWAMREAARREATVVAVRVADGTTPEQLLREELDGWVQRATADADGSVRVQTGVLDPAVLMALAGAARGGDLVMVGAAGKTLLRHAVPRLAPRRATRGA